MRNLSVFVEVSGTVGAARTAARRSIPSAALSQGSILVEPDFPAGVTVSLDWLEQFWLGHAGPPFMEVHNVNIPSCAPGSSVRGTVETVVAPSLDGRLLLEDCTSTETVVNDDIDAFIHGFVGIDDAGLGL